MAEGQGAAGAGAGGGAGQGAGAGAAGAGASGDQGKQDAGQGGQGKAGSEGGGKGQAQGSAKGDEDSASLLGGAGIKKDAKAGGEGSGKKDEAKGQEKVDGQKQGAPEKYADFKLPEGLTLNKAALEKFSGTAKELGLSQEQAQKLVDLQAEIVKGDSDSTLAEFEKTTQAWKDDTKKALGANYEESLGVAAKAIERFGTPQLRQLLDDTRVGNHPELVQFFVKVGKAISEDTFSGEGKPKGQPKSDGELFYPKMAEQAKK